MAEYEQYPQQVHTEYPDNASETPIEFPEGTPEKVHIPGIHGGTITPFQKGHQGPVRSPSYEKQKKAGAIQLKAQTTRKLRQMLIEEGCKVVRINGVEQTRLQRVAERIYDEAEAGQAWAANMIFDRIEGKAPNTTDDEADKVKILILRPGVSMDEL